MLHDRLVCGINDGEIQQQLLSEKELTPKWTWEIFVRMESADKYADDLQQPGAVNPVHVVKNQPQNSEELYYSCGESTKQKLVHSRKPSAAHVKNAT